MQRSAAALFGPVQTVVEARTDGSVRLRSAIALQPSHRSMAAAFRAGADRHPDRLLAAERDGDGWRTLTWGQARQAADALAQGLISVGLVGRPIMILSGNSVDHLLLTLAGYTCGAPLVPVTTAYSLASHDHAKLRGMAELVDPGLVFAADPEEYAGALRAVSAPGRVLAASRAGDGLPVLPLGELMAAGPTGAVEEYAARVGSGTIAKILFTSGSTGTPKGVINTHQMMCTNQQMMRQAWPFLAEEPPVLLDWLPWSHTFGSNHNLNMILVNGGTLWIDDGRPAPGLIGRTLRNLAEVTPNIYFNVPAGLSLLVPALEEDRELARRFFAGLRLVFFAAAALPQVLWDRIEALAASVGQRVPMTTSWGATETAPAVTSAYFASARSDCIGVPLPGVELKLVPAAGKQEIRVRGPNVTPGYYRNPAATEAAFDSEGFYRTGDAVRFADPARPDAGLLFDGRIAEDFKLATGTWVSVGTLRTTLLNASNGLIKDAVLAGHDGAYVAALAWINTDQAGRLTGSSGDHCASGANPSVGLHADPAVRAGCLRALDILNSAAGGSSQRILRLLLLDEPPSLDGGEITDKGYINQRVVLERRARLVARLYAEDPPADVICWQQDTPASSGSRADSASPGRRPGRSLSDDPDQVSHPGRIPW
jgi:feruloyl-CoA synthase